MKLTKRQLRKIVKEELTKQPSLTELFGTNWEEEAERTGDPPPITKVGDLRKMIKTLKSEKRSKAGAAGLEDIGMGILADLVPGGGTALSVAQALKAMYSAPDEKKTDTYLDKLNVDDEIAAIVDDTVEDNFLNKAMELIEGLPDDADIPDINEELSNWLKGKYDARTVVGFEEGRTIKITKHQLRKLVNEDHPRPDDDYDPLNPDDDEDDAAYDQGYDDGFNGYPSNPVVGGDYHVGYEEGVNAAKDEASRAEDAEEFGPHSPGMMGPPRREGKVRLTKRQLKRIIKEEKRRMLSEAVVPKEQLEDAILNIFYVEGAVTSVDVYDRLRMDGYTDEEISGGISNRGGAPWAE